MGPIALLIAAFIAPLALAVPTPGNTYGTGGSAPAGWDASVENFCTVPDVLACCTGAIAGVAGEPDATGTGCINAMAGGQITYEFGYCPYDYALLCCAPLLLLVSTLAAAFRLKLRSLRVEGSGSNAIWLGKTEFYHWRYAFARLMDS